MPDKSFNDNYSVKNSADDGMVMWTHPFIMRRHAEEEEIGCETASEVLTNHARS